MPPRKLPTSPAVIAEACKSAAQQSYCELLRIPTALLGSDLVAEATSPDFEEARRSLQHFLDEHDPARAPNQWAAQNRTDVTWSWRYGSPQARAEQYGIPFLRSAIEQRKRDEAETERQARVYEVRLKLPYAGVELLLDRAVPADEEATRETIAHAIARHFEHALYPPPEPPKPRQPTHSELLVAAAHADSPGAQFRRTVTEAHARLPQLPARDSHPGAMLPGLAARPEEPA
jgi:hypothetical protein